jgi:hypothetical protein
MGDDLMVVLELDPKSGVRQQFRDDTGKFQEFFLRHSLSEKSFAVRPGSLHGSRAEICAGH